MSKNVLAVVLLGILGLTAGVTFGALFPQPQSYYVNAGILLPAHSAHSAADLTLMTRDDHPGVRVVALGGRHIGVFATGSLGGAERAVNLAVRKVIAANDGKVGRHWDGLISRVPNSGHGLMAYGLTGLLAGFGTALSLLVFRRSRMTGMPSGAHSALPRQHS